MSHNKERMRYIKNSPDNQLPLVSIGVAAYNRPELLKRALSCITCQTYKKLEIIISDDCSPGEGTKGVIEQFASRDSRIHTYRQEKNLGIVGNNKFVFEKSTGDFFIWLQEDDEWPELFIEAGVQALLNNPDFDAWCCTMDNIDYYGRVIRTYPGFSKYTSTSNRTKDIIRYLLEPEILGKSQIFHSLFTRQSLKTTIREYWINENWGTDHSFNAAFLARFRILGSDDVLFHKRVVLPNTENGFYISLELKDNPAKHIFPFKESVTYILEHYKAVRTTPYALLVVIIMVFRVPRALWNDLINNNMMKRVTIRLSQKMKGQFRKIEIFLRSKYYYLAFNYFSGKYPWNYKQDIRKTDVRWGIVDTLGTIDVPLEQIVAPICTSHGNQIMQIANTPHYRWIKNLVEGNSDVVSKMEYYQYNKTFFPEDNAEEQSDSIMRLVAEFQKKQDFTIEIVICPPKKLFHFPPPFVIFDGVHRAAIAKAFGHKTIRCRIVMY